MEKNRADVIICGTSYVLSSEKSEERIKDIARMVDEELRATSKALNVNPNYKAAVLTALNIAEKLMDNTDMTLKLQTENYQLDNDVKHYIQMWEQSKKQVTDLKEKMSSEFDRQTKDSEDQKKLQEKLVEMENAYFDLQMENVNLKNELKSTGISLYVLQAIPTISGISTKNCRTRSSTEQHRASDASVCRSEMIRMPPSFSRGRLL